MLLWSNEDCPTLSVPGQRCRIHYVQLLTIIYLLYFTLVVQLKLQSWRLSPAPLLFGTRHFSPQHFAATTTPSARRDEPPTQYRENGACQHTWFDWCRLYKWRVLFGFGVRLFCFTATHDSDGLGDVNCCIHTCIEECTIFRGDAVVNFIL